MFRGPDFIAKISDGLKIIDPIFITCDDIGKLLFVTSLKHLKHTVSHFSYAPLINVKLLEIDICYTNSETTSIKRIYICISHRNFIVIKWVTSEKMDLEGHYPQNTISHCIISNETQITMHFFQGRISAMPEIRADLFLATSKTGMGL